MLKIFLKKQKFVVVGLFGAANSVRTVRGGQFGALSIRGSELGAVRCGTELRFLILMRSPPISYLIQQKWDP